MEEIITKKSYYKFAQVPYYRTTIHTQLKAFRIVYKETDLLVLSETHCEKEVLNLLKNLRNALEKFILLHPEFKTSLLPLSYKDTQKEKIPSIIKKMLRAGQIAEVGPMASVAGAIAEEIGKALLKQGITKQVVIENGGDIFLSLNKDAKVALFAGDSPFSGKIGVLIKKELMPCGVCTSSSKIGHSLNFGKADAVTVIHKDTAISDALATHFSNLLKSPQDFNKIVNKAKKIKGLIGVVGILGEQIFFWGNKLKLLILNEEKVKL